MLTRPLLITAGLVLITLIAPGSLGNDPVESKDRAAAPKGVAVVELFTSEGCSSCPRADHVLSDLRKQAKKEGAPIYAIAFHVDYWNKLGWLDRFSSPDFTARQRGYRAAMRLPSIYTPQMMINGSIEFTGSDRSRADREIARALAIPATVTVSATITERGPNKAFLLEITTSGSPKNALACAALAEDDLSTQVKAGENSGHDLHHDGVVRAFATHAIGPDGKTRLTLEHPGDVMESNASIIVFIQSKSTKRILGATELSLKTEQAPSPTGH